MAYNYIERYWNKFSNYGFKRIVNGGFDCKNIYLDYFPTETGPGHSNIYTGADPKYSGIIGNNWYNRNTGQTIYCVSDTTVNTVGSFSSDGKMSPRNLLVTTITDQLKLTSNFHSKVIGISLKDRAAILPAGHMADAAYWYDQPSKYFVTSSYYMQKIPGWVDTFNRKDFPDEYMSKDWNTLLPIEEYTESTQDDNNYERKFKGEEKPVFPHKLSELKYNNPGAFQYSPYGNSVTKDFAIEVLKNENLGKGDYTDFLCINFASTDYVGHMYGPNSIEVEDTYIRFDKDLSELLEYIDKNIGMENVLIFLTADHGNSPNPLFLKDHKIDAGAYYEDRVKDSSSVYLKKVFGLNDCILKVMNQQIYLNRDLINNMHLNINVVEDSLAGYLKNSFNEIESTYPVYKLSQESLSDKYAKAFWNGYYEKRCGELFINFKPYYLWGHTNRNGTRFTLWI